MTFTGETNVIVVRYVPTSKPRFVKILGDGKYEEVENAQDATTFHKQKAARRWANKHVKYPEYTSVEDIKFFLNPLKGS